MVFVVLQSFEGFYIGFFVVLRDGGWVRGFFVVFGSSNVSVGFLLGFGYLGFFGVPQSFGS